MNAGPKRLVLIIGGAYGHDELLKLRADALVSLSKMTFNHQVVRLLAMEQLYRAYSILKGDPYHND
jgi:23S rRNA (pseudouridine1915-N3)-methyltransferase